MHIDHPWSECVRMDGAPVRVYVRTPWWYLMAGESAQVYDWKTRSYTTRWARVVVHPRERVR